MLAAANVMPGENVVDLGAGDGRIVYDAARTFNANATGIEIHPGRYKWALSNLQDVASHARIRRQNFYETDLTNADVVTMYLLPSVNDALRKKLERELQPGARVVTHDFPMVSWRPEHIEIIQGPRGRDLIFVYRI
jgi:cyclopropane fatty-acyl-phospholipid synthase-like methyltransferase